MRDWLGLMVLRAAVQDFKDIEIVGINDLLQPDHLAYMLTYDSVHGRFQGQVSVDGNTLVVNGRKIRLTAVKDPAELKWNEVGADVIIESTGLFLTKQSAEKHAGTGAKKVIVSAPSKDDTPMFVYGVNDKSYAGQQIISNACPAMSMQRTNPARWQPSKQEQLSRIMPTLFA